MHLTITYKHLKPSKISLTVVNYRSSMNHGS